MITTITRIMKMTRIIITTTNTDVSRMDPMITITTTPIQSQLPWDAPSIPSLSWPHLPEKPVMAYTFSMPQTTCQITTQPSTVSHVSKCGICPSSPQNRLPCHWQKHCSARARPVTPPFIPIVLTPLASRNGTHLRCRLLPEAQQPQVDPKVGHPCKDQ